jgi:hypothetical protein
VLDHQIIPGVEQELKIRQEVLDRVRKVMDSSASPVAIEEEKDVIEKKPKKEKKEKKEGGSKREKKTAKKSLDFTAVLPRHKEKEIIQLQRAIRRHLERKKSSKQALRPPSTTLRRFWKLGETIERGSTR